MKRKLPSYVVTYAVVDDREYDNVKVHFDASPAEPDVGWPGGFELECAMHNGHNLMEDMTDREIDDLSMRVQEHLTSYMEDYD
jgi:hypothetical protein